MARKKQTEVNESEPLGFVSPANKDSKFTHYQAKAGPIAIRTAHNGVKYAVGFRVSPTAWHHSDVYIDLETAKEVLGHLAQAIQALEQMGKKIV